VSGPDAVVKTDQTLQLPDGRTLGFAEYGSVEGNVLVYCQGYPGSRLEAAALSAHAAQANVRVISLDRPGFGRSSFQERRSFLDWPSDRVALTERLRIDRFAVLGASGGVVSGIGPLKLGTAGVSRQNRLVLFLAHQAPWLLTPLLLTPLLRATARSFRDEERARKAVTKAMRRMVKPDREALLAHGLVDQLAASTRETYHQGVKGAVYEGGLYGRDWGFRLEDIAFRPLYRWHGARDTNVPIGMARGMAGKLAGCKATYYPGEGHLSTLHNHQSEFFRPCLRRWRNIISCEVVHTGGWRERRCHSRSSFVTRSCFIPPGVSCFMLLGGAQ
jgi:pimeloyl-ACP methyl ester carboxylesterase